VIRLEPSQLRAACLVNKRAHRFPLYHGAQCKHFSDKLQADIVDHDATLRNDAQQAVGSSCED